MTQLHSSITAITNKIVIKNNKQILLFLTFLIRGPKSLRQISVISYFTLIFLNFYVTFYQFCHFFFQRLPDIYTLEKHK